MNAVSDSPTHVIVKPIGGTVRQWMVQGADSEWTRAVESVVRKWTP